MRYCPLYLLDENGEAYYDFTDKEHSGHYQGKTEADFCEPIEEKLEKEEN